MKVDGFDLGIWEESVLIEEHCASSVVGHEEPVREKLMVNILDRFLQCDDMPLACDLLLNNAFFSTLGSRIPVQVNGKARCCRSDTPDKMYRVFWRMLRGILKEPF